MMFESRLVHLSPTLIKNTSQTQKQTSLTYTSTKSWQLKPERTRQSRRYDEIIKNTFQTQNQTSLTFTSTKSWQLKPERTRQSRRYDEITKNTSQTQKQTSLSYTSSKSWQLKPERTRQSRRYDEIHVTPPPLDTFYGFSFIRSILKTHSQSDTKITKNENTGESEFRKKSFRHQLCIGERIPEVQNLKIVIFELVSFNIRPTKKDLLKRKCLNQIN